MPRLAEFLLGRLVNAGVGHIFGVPGDYVLDLFRKIEDSPDIELIGTTDEAHAGFAADAYARVHGIGCVAATYNVGSLKCLNPVAGAFSERSPVVVLVGSPGIKERESGLLLHHTVRDFDTQRQIFSNITCANTVLDDPMIAAYEIDRVLVALKYYRQPVYIEMPRDMASKGIGYDVDQGTPEMPRSDPASLAEALDEVVGWLRTAKRPVILAGVELSRFGMGERLVRFAEQLNIPIFTETLSKSTVGELHPLFVGVYSGHTASPRAKQLVEGSDCILMLGVMLTDMVLGRGDNWFASGQTVRANVGSVKVRNHGYDDVVFQEFCDGLFASYASLPRNKDQGIPPREHPVKFVPFAGAKVTTERFFAKVGSIIGNKTVVIADVGDSLFGAIDLVMPTVNTFVSPAYYASMGMAIPASLGVCLAKPGTRPIVLVGDGSFQMSCSEVSSLVRMGLNPIIFVLNNGGYTTERLLLDGKFNDIANWNYHEIGSLVGGGVGFKVTTEDELEDAVNAALGSIEVSVINVVVRPTDMSRGLGRVISGVKKIN